MVVVPDVDRARRGADGRAGADRRRRGDRGRGLRRPAIAAVQENGLSIPGSLLGITLHVGAMLAVMGVVATLVYDHVGVSVLKKAWLNLDWVWAGAFVLAGVLTLFA